MLFRELLIFRSKSNAVIDLHQSVETFAVRLLLSEAVKDLAVLAAQLEDAIVERHHHV